MSEENFDALEQNAQGDEFSEEEFDNLIYLSDDEGNETAFEYLDSVDYEGEEYVVLISTDEDDDEVVILKVESLTDEDEFENFVSIDDEAVLEAVFEIFKENNKEYFDFAD